MLSLFEDFFADEPYEIRDYLFFEFLIDFLLDDRIRVVVFGNELCMFISLASVDLILACSSSGLDLVI